jgi:lysophospholipase L1-like esterase
VLSPSKPSGHRRILFIGDSTCWGLGVPIERSFAALSTRLLGEEDPGQTLEFLVGAFPGYSSYQSKIVLEHLLPMQPDLVVLYVGARNDSTRARYFPDSDIPRRRARLGESWHQVRLLRSMEGLLDRSYRSFFRKLRSEAAGVRVPPEDFLANLAEMAEQLDRVGVKALVVVPPLSEAQAARHPFVQQYRRMLEESAHRHELAMVRLQPSFAGEDPAVVYFEDGYHLSEQGHRIAAEAIRTAVVEEGLLGQTRGPAAVVRFPAAP